MPGAAGWWYAAAAAACEAEVAPGGVTSGVSAAPPRPLPAAAASLSVGVAAGVLAGARGVCAPPLLLSVRLAAMPVDTTWLAGWLDSSRAACWAPPGVSGCVPAAAGVPVRSCVPAPTTPQGCDAGTAPPVAAAAAAAAGVCWRSVSGAAGVLLPGLVASGPKGPCCGGETPVGGDGLTCWACCCWAWRLAAAAASREPAW